MAMNMHKSFPAPRHVQSGFTLIEMMIGMTVGLLVTLAIAAVLVNAENQRRTTTSGSDAQINGGLAVYTIERQLKMAGYGIVNDSPTTGCTLTVQNAGTAAPGAPPVLAPVLITAGLNGAPDSIRILSSSSSNFVMSMPIAPPYYDPDQVASAQNTTFKVASTLGVLPNDLLALVYNQPGDTTCEVFQATAVTDATTISRINSATWNANRFPSKAAQNGAYLVDLGKLIDITFSVTADQRLSQSVYSLASQISSAQDLQSNIVTLKALYGKDPGVGVVNTFDNVTPTTNAGWTQVHAVRIAIVARSAQYEHDIVTPVAPQWDVGNVDTVPGSVACGTTHCLPLKIDNIPDWQHYRYKVFDVLVPLRNQLWSQAPVAP